MNHHGQLHAQRWGNLTRPTLRLFLTLVSERKMKQARKYGRLPPPAQCCGISHAAAGRGLSASPPKADGAAES